MVLMNEPSLLFSTLHESTEPCYEKRASRLEDFHEVGRPSTNKFHFRISLLKCD